MHPSPNLNFKPHQYWGFMWAISGGFTLPGRLQSVGRMGVHSMSVQFGMNTGDVWFYGVRIARVDSDWELRSVASRHSQNSTGI